MSSFEGDPICEMSVLGLAIECSTSIKEIPCTADSGSLFTTGGSFSGFYTTPSYQKSVVTQYLKSGAAPPAKYFNSTGRAYNDVTALGDNVLIIVQNQISLLCGTSASGNNSNVSNCS